MIPSFSDRDTAELFAGKRVKRFANLASVAERKLRQLDSATTLDALRAPPGNRLEALSADRKGQHSIRINDPWRVCFVWTAEGVRDVEIVDYHCIQAETKMSIAAPKNGMRPIHPGEILREDYLKPLDMSANALAQALHVPASRINDIVLERRGVTVDTAFRLVRYFGGDVQTWMNLQTAYEISLAKGLLAEKVEREVTPLAA